MKRQMILVIFLLITMGSASGQKINYSGSLESVFLSGSAEPAFAFNITQGIRIQQWNISLGAGMDYYRFRSMPVFIDVKRSFKLWKIAPYLQVSGGAHFVKPKDDQRVIHYTFSSWFPAADTASLSGGRYLRVNTGVIINPAAKIKCGVFAGWCNKQVTATYQELVFNGSGNVKENTYMRYSLNRTSVGLVVIF